MNKLELIKQLKILNIPNSYYSFNGDKPDAYIFEDNKNHWKIYYVDERGNQNDIREFTKESEACNYFLNELKEEL